MEEIEWIKAVNAFMIKYENATILTAQEKTILFNLHNARVKEKYFPTQEHGKHCGACVSRVFKRVKNYWEKNIKIVEKDVTLKTDEE